MGFAGIFGPRTGHQPLFSDLCRFHNIDKKTRQLLKDVTDKLQLERPAELFVEPALLQKAMNSPEFSNSTEDLQALYKAWFGK
ncbi:MAG: hypothetical protein LBN39_06880 [Planctomycetaceae bacterium]|jgi:hypothetical protein|nr:hypothetical protein [Planctomycetaceae bacterium]